MRLKKIFFNQSIMRAALKKLDNFITVTKANGIILIYAITVLVVRLQTGVITAPDTQGYIDKEIIRPPGYPLIIDIFKYLFGSHEYFALVCFQIIFVLISVFYISHVLRKMFSLHPITLTLLYVFLSLPLLSISVAVGVHGGIGNRILTESISDGFFLFTVSFLVKTLFHEKRNFLIFILFIALLSLIRTQMIFMYLIAMALLLYLYLKIGNFRLIMRFFTAMLAIFLIAEASERFYHKSVNNYFGKLSLNVSHMLVGVVFISDQHALKYISNENDRKVLKQAYDYLENRKFLSKNRFEIDLRLVDLYNDSFNISLYYGLMRSFQSVYSLPKWGGEELIKFEDFSKRVLPSLTVHHYKDFGKLLLLKFLYTLNFREGFLFCLILLLPFIRVSHEFKMFAFFVFAMLIVSRLAMTPIIYLGDRYLFYTDILEYIIFLMMAEKYLSCWKSNSRTSESKASSHP